MALWLPVCMGAGVAVYFALAREPSDWLAAVICGLAASGAWLAPAGSARRGALAGLAACALGVVVAQIATWRSAPLEPLPSRAVVVSGVVAGVELLPGGAQRVIVTQPRLHPDSPPLARDLRIGLRADDPARPEAGDHLTVRALLRAPPPPVLPGAWDVQRNSFFAGVAGSGRALGQAVVTPRTAGDGPARWIERLREAIAWRFAAGLAEAEGAIGSALFTGFMAAIPRSDIVAFRDSGLAHLLSVSGLHVVIVIGLVFGLVRVSLACSEHAALHWPCKQIAAMAGFAAALFYTPLAGWQIPLLRSVAMAGLVVLAMLVGRRAISLRSLGLAAVAVLVWAPVELAGPSFQMSFAAVLALIAGHEAARPWLLATAASGGWGRRLALRSGTSVLTSLLAGVATAPFGVYHFGRAQSWFMLANFLAVPLTGLWIMPTGLIALALMPFDLEWLALAPMGWGLELLLWIAHGTAGLPAATSDLPAMPLWGLLAVTSGLLWLAIWRSALRLAGAPVLLLGMLSPWITLDEARSADILVSADARLVGVRTEVGLFAQAGPGFLPFTLEAWERYWALHPRGLHLPDDVPGIIACEGALCRLGGGRVLLLRQGQALPADFCAGVALVIAVEPLREGCPGAQKIDRFTVWREGAHAVWLEPGTVRVLSDRQARGWRPWVELPVRRRPELPAAVSE